MAEYSSLKVPELKKLLAEKKLSQTGNKADLIARLQEADGGVEAVSAEQPAAATEDAAAVPAPEPTTEEPSAPPATTEAAPETAAEPPAAPAPSFAMGLSSTAADDEAKKRADRAKRFGIEEDDAAIKRADRAKRFGLDEKELATGLDAALPERSLKRGRGRNAEGGDGGSRPGKRQSLDRRGGDRRGERNGRDAPRGGGGGGGGGGSRGIQDDPTEKAKAEKRAARFAAA